MIEFDFIPLSRRQVRRRTRRVRTWTNVCLAYVGLAIASCAVLILIGWRADGRAVDDELERTIHRIRETDDIVTDMRRQVAEVEQTLAAAKRIGGQPDWSVLLAVLAEETDDAVVLRRCAVAPAGGERDRAGATGTAPVQFTVNVSGFGRSQQAVSRYVLRLEEVGLFQSVTLTGSKREPFLRGYAVAFDVHCTLDDPGNGDEGGAPDG
ncbi:MAG: PilN domain-containing protein [Planctomycetota bacterium]|jgi:Tfp pilus assembly protein PilN